MLYRNALVIGKLHNTIRTLRHLPKNFVT